ncbi:MAG: pyridoxal phosphate-dependent aminotransferase family protein, partial [Bacteroidota bacterium]
MSIFDKLVGGPLGRYASYAHGYFAFPKLEGQLGNHMVFKGKEVICWSINNYLGLANHPEVREIDNEAMKEWGMAYPMGSRILTGETTYHEKLEKSLAEFVDKEAAMLLNYGYQGIMSVIDTVLGRNDVVVYDKECHACIYDGVRMHVGKRLPFEHNDMDSLRAQLVKATELVKARKGGILVISEGVFGMKGDQGKLREIVQMKEEFDFQLLVDDAHGFGTLGETGMGTGEEQGVQEEIDLYFTTFAKSMASLGAFVAGPKEVITFLKYNARSQVFAKTLP